MSYDHTQTLRYAETVKTLRAMESDRDLSARLHLDSDLRGDRLMADAFRQSYIDRADRVRVYRADALRPMGDRIMAAADQ